MVTKQDQEAARINENRNARARHSQTSTYINVKCSLVKKMSFVYRKRIATDYLPHSIIEYFSTSFRWPSKFFSQMRQTKSSVLCCKIIKGNMNNRKTSNIRLLNWVTSKHNSLSLTNCMPHITITPIRTMINFSHDQYLQNTIKIL